MLNVTKVFTAAIAENGIFEKELFAPDIVLFCKTFVVVGVNVVSADPINPAPQTKITLFDPVGGATEYVTVILVALTVRV